MGFSLSVRDFAAYYACFWRVMAIKMGVLPGRGSEPDGFPTESLRRGNLLMASAASGGRGEMARQGKAAPSKLAIGHVIGTLKQQFLRMAIAASDLARGVAGYGEKARSSMTTIVVIRAVRAASRLVG